MNNYALHTKFKGLTLKVEVIDIKFNLGFPSQSLNTKWK